MPPTTYSYLVMGSKSNSDSHHRSLVIAGLSAAGAKASYLSFHLLFHHFLPTISYVFHPAGPISSPEFIQIVGT